jgi:hypothetical protein
VKLDIGVESVPVALTGGIKKWLFQRAGLMMRPFAAARPELTLDVRPVGSPEKLRRTRFGIGDGPVIGGTPYFNG